jgi:uncharacterized membrane protein YvlD (DUF360 family)
MNDNGRLPDADRQLDQHDTAGSSLRTGGNSAPPVDSGLRRQSMRRALWKRVFIGVGRLIAIIIIQAVVLYLVAQILPGVSLDSVGTPTAVSVAMLVVMVLIWPLFIRIFFKLVIYTGGLVTVLVNGFIVQVAAWISPGLDVDNFGWAILYAFVVTIFLTALLGLISFEDQGTFKRIILRRQRRQVDPSIVGKPGVIFLEIDGLSHDALIRAMAAGKTRTMRKWRDSGSHVLVSWETDLSSQTSASQAGILHGNNSEIPAFRWFDKELGMVVVSSNLRVLGPFEKLHSDGNGLLAHGGAARASMLSGDADEVMLVASRPRDEKSESYRSFFASPLSFTHTVSLFFWEMILETGSKWSQRIRKVQPRIDRHFKYTVIRAGMTVALRDLSLNGVIADMLRGAPYCYVTLAGYDEVAHHSGLDRHDTLTVLRKIDARFRSLENMAKIAPRDYRFVVVSDHGQTQGATFLQRYGYDLEELVRSSVSQGTAVGGPSTYAKEGAGAGVAKGQSDWEHVATVDEAVEESGAGKNRLGRLLRKRLRAGDAVPTIVTDAVVMASGNLGLVSFTGPKHRVTLEEVERDHPELISKLVAHPGVGFVMMATAADGAGRGGDAAVTEPASGAEPATATDTVIIGKNGRYYLGAGPGNERVVGEDPLLTYGPNAVRHLRRTTSFSNCPDILIMSTYWAETDEDAAFEELVGNHGGLGGEQTRPFLLYPAEWQLDAEELIGAETVYRNLKRWTAITA